MNIYVTFCNHSVSYIQGDKAALQWLYDSFTYIPQSEYRNQAVMRNKTHGNYVPDVVPRNLIPWQNEDDTNPSLACPTGLLPSVLDMLVDSGKGIEVVMTDAGDAAIEVLDSRIEGLRWEPLDANPSVPLFGFQNEAVSAAISAQRGIISAPTASGKTIIGAEIIRQLRLPFVYFVDRGPLVQQAYDDLKNYMPDLNISAYGGGFKRTPAGKIHGTVCLFSSAKHVDMLDKCVVIADECHRVAASGYCDAVMSAEIAQYRIGLTGTATGRSDGDDVFQVSVLGSVVYSIDYSDLVSVGRVCPYEAAMVRVPVPDHVCRLPSHNYSKIETGAVVNNADALNVICYMCSGLSMDGSRTFVFTRRREHAKLIHDTLSGLDLPSRLCWGGDTLSPEELRSLPAGSIVVATNLLATGTDAPAFDTLINAGSGRSSIEVAQRCGRILRAADGKDHAAIYDLWYCGSERNKAAMKAYPAQKIMEAQGAERAKIYRKTARKVYTVSHTDICHVQ